MLKKIVIYLIVFLLMLIPLVVSDLEFSNPNLPKLTPDPIPVIAFDNITGRVNFSEFTNCWLTNEGKKCNVPDIDYSEFGGSSFWDADVDFGSRNLVTGGTGTFGSTLVLGSASIEDSGGSIDFGSNSLTTSNTIGTSTLLDTNGNTAIDVDSRFLTESASSITRYDWEQGYFYTSDGNNVLIDIFNGQIFDSSQNTAIDWENRYLGGGDWWLSDDSLALQFGAVNTDYEIEFNGTEVVHSLGSSATSIYLNGWGGAEGLVIGVDQSNNARSGRLFWITNTVSETWNLWNNNGQFTFSSGGTVGSSSGSTRMIMTTGGIISELNTIIDISNTEALLIRKNGDAGDIFKVDTSGDRITMSDGSSHLVFDPTGFTSGELTLGPTIFPDGTNNDLTLATDTGGQVSRIQMTGYTGTLWRNVLSFDSTTGGTPIELKLVESEGLVSIPRDNGKFYWGGGKDSSASYNGSDMLINPREVGLGGVHINGSLNVVNNITGNQIYGEIWNKTASASPNLIPIDATGIYYNVTNMTGGSMNGFNFTNTDRTKGGSYMTAQVSGKYRAVATICTQVGSASGDLYGYAISHEFERSNHDNCYARRTAVNKFGCVSISCFMDVEENTRVNLQIEQETGATPRDITYTTANLNLVRVGDI